MKIIGIIIVIIIVIIGGYMLLRSDTTDITLSPDLTQEVPAPGIEPGSVDEMMVVKDQTDTQPGNEVTVPEEVVISMTSSGYTPKNITIAVGTTVTFINDDTVNLWTASNIHPTHAILPEFDSKGTVKPGESYSFTFTKVGLWPYHDHRFPSVTGIITVTE